MTLECGLVEVVVDGLIFLVVDETVEDASLLDRVLHFVALEELLFWGGQVNFPLKCVLCFWLVVRDGLRLQIHEVEVLVVLTRSALIFDLLLFKELVAVVFEWRCGLLQLSP